MALVKLLQSVVVRMHYDRIRYVSDLVSTPAGAPRPVDIFGILEVLIERHPLPNGPSDRGYRHREAMPPMALAGTISVGVVRILSQQRAATGAGHLPAEYAGHASRGQPRPEPLQPRNGFRRARGIPQHQAVTLRRRHALVRKPVT